MGRKPKYSKKIKIKACEKYISGKGSFGSIAKEVGCNKAVLRSWYYSYLENGEQAFNTNDRNRAFTKDFKISVVESILTGNEPVMSIASKYDISQSVVYGWIKKYNNGMEITDYDPKGDVYTMKSRKTTFDERIEIVDWIIANNLDYKNAADKFQVKYATVRSWTLKYLEDGKEALKHQKRGPKPKSKIDESQLSEVERLKLDLERERRLRERAELAVKVLKKKEEFERKLHTRK